MAENMNADNRPVNPRRRKRSKIQVFKEAYLPVIIVGVTLLLILIFLIGSIVRGFQHRKYNAHIAAQESIALQEEQDRLSKEAADLITKATALVSHYDYEGALSILSSFSGTMSDFPDLQEKYDSCKEAQNNLVLWDDPSKVLNLSFQVLIADSNRAFTDEVYGTSYNRNFITTSEFSRILQQLYENGYILVSLSHITGNDGPKELYLPNGKKPLIITQTNVNYYTYMIDGDGDKLPDKDGSGFASKLIVDANGNLACEMVDETGNVVTGAFDMVPILDSFIETHPGFSYKGAKAILAVTGYDGVFGYRTSPAAKEFFGSAYHTDETEKAAQVVDALRSNGYEIACYTYENEPYGDYTVDQIAEELNKWVSEVTPVLGETDIFVFSRNSDIEQNGVVYSGDKFYAIYDRGFRYFLGFCEEGMPWYTASTDYIRQGRILVTGDNLKNNGGWFEGIFDASSVLDSNRPTE